MLISRLKWSAYLAYHLRGQARFSFGSLDTIRRAQSRRVQSMVSYAYRAVPYYRETMNRLGLRPEDFKTAEDLEKLPIIEREQLQRDPKSFISTAMPIDSYLKLRSGGSSGVPCTIYHDAAGIFQNAAHSERERCMITHLTGKSYGYRETVFGSAFGSDQLVQEFIRSRGFFASGMQIKRQYLSVMDSPQENVSLLNEFKPDHIHSYGSYLEVLFSYLHSVNRPFHRPKIITYSSDALSQSARRLITQTIGIPVLSTYETIEAFKIGFECRQGLGLHANMDLYPVRIVDAKGKSLPDSKSGNVVVSNLVNRGTVLLNYRLDDICHMQRDPCPCGRSLPLLSLPEGRSSDWIELSSGQRLHPQVVADIFDETEAIWQFQVIQDGYSDFRAWIVASPNCDRETISRQIIDNLKVVLGESSVLNLAFVDQIERSAGGKLRPVVSKLQRKENHASFGVSSHIHQE